MQDYTIDENGAILINFDGSLLLGHQHSGPGDGGVLAVGVTDTDLTAGSVWFTGAGGLLQQDNANLFWDDGNDRLGVETNSPAASVDIYGDLRFGSASGSGALIVSRDNVAGSTYRDLTIVGNDVEIKVATTDEGAASETAIFCEKITGDVGMGSITPVAKLHIDQFEAGGNKPPLLLVQADVSEEMMQFSSTIGVGNAIEAVGAKTLTVTHFIKMTITGGLTRYFPIGTIA